MNNQTVSVNIITQLSVNLYSNRFLDGFPDLSQFVVAKLTHYSAMPHRPSDSSRPRQHLLLSGDVPQNPGPATKYSCSVCTSNVTSIWYISIWSIDVVLVGFIRSVLIFETQRGTVELRTGHGPHAFPHPPHQYRNRFHHQLQVRLSMWIPSRFCNSMQMA